MSPERALFGFFLLMGRGNEARAVGGGKQCEGETISGLPGSWLGGKDSTSTDDLFGYGGEG